MRLLRTGCLRQALTPEGFRDPWPGAKNYRINSHWSNPMKQAKPGNCNEAGYAPGAGAAGAGQRYAVTS